MKNLVIGLGLSVWFGFATVHAATVPATFVLEKAAKEHAKIKQVELEGKIIDLRNKSSFKETLRLDFVNRKGTAWATNEAGETLGLHTFKFSELPALGSAWIVLGFDPSYAQLKKTLELLNVGLSDAPVKLARYRVNSTQLVNWSWGEANHVYFSKDEASFAGLQAVDTGDEILAENFNAATGGFSFPKTLYVNRSGNPLFSYEVKISKFNAFSKTPFPKSTARTSPPVQEWFNLVR